MQNNLCVSAAVKAITKILKNGKNETFHFYEPRRDFNITVTFEFEKSEIKVLEDGTKWKKVV